MRLSLACGRMDGMHHIRDFLAKYKQNPRKALGGLAWLVVFEVVWELSKHRVCAWANERLDRGAGPMIEQLRNMAQGAIDHPLLSILLTTMAGCAGLVFYAFTAIGIASWLEIRERKRRMASTIAELAEWMDESKQRKIAITTVLEGINGRLSLLEEKLTSVETTANSFTAALQESLSLGNGLAKANADHFAITDKQILSLADDRIKMVSEVSNDRRRVDALARQVELFNSVLQSSHTFCRYLFDINSLIAGIEGCITTFRRLKGHVWRAKPSRAAAFLGLARTSAFSHTATRRLDPGWGDVGQVTGGIYPASAGLP